MWLLLPTNDCASLARLYRTWAPFRDDRKASTRFSQCVSRFQSALVWSTVLHSMKAGEECRAVALEVVGQREGGLILSPNEPRLAGGRSRR